MDNPSLTTHSVREFMVFVKFRRELTRKYNIQQAGVDVLVQLTSEWMINRKAMTVFNLTGGNGDKITTMCYVVRRLLDRGLIDVVGHGKFGSNAYAPSGKLLMEFSDMGLVA